MGTSTPTLYPTTEQPSKSPTWIPTLIPTTQSPSHYPTKTPTGGPTSNMTTDAPTKSPSLHPTRSPTSKPSTSSPTAQPTKSPKLPTSAPSAGDVPIGFYKGQKTILKYVVNANMRFEQPESCGISIVIAAANVNITCTDEEYTMNGNSIELTHVNEEGDCLHDQMKDVVSLKSIPYSKDSNQVTVKVKYKILTESIDLVYDNE